MYQDPEQQILTNMEQARAELTAAIDRAIIGDAEENARRLANIEDAAAKMLTSPLFRGTDAAPQVELFGTSKP